MTTGRNWSPPLPLLHQPPSPRRCEPPWSSSCCVCCELCCLCTPVWWLKALEMGLRKHSATTIQKCLCHPPRSCHDPLPHVLPAANFTTPILGTFGLTDRLFFLPSPPNATTFCSMSPCYNPLPLSLCTCSTINPPPVHLPYTMALACQFDATLTVRPPPLCY